MRLAGILALAAACGIVVDAIVLARCRSLQRLVSRSAGVGDGAKHRGRVLGHGHVERKCACRPNPQRWRLEIL